MVVDSGRGRAWRCFPLTVSSILTALAAATKAHALTWDGESADQPDRSLSEASSLPTLRGGPELRVMYPFGLGLGLGFSTFLAETLSLAARYDFLFVTMPDQNTTAHTGHFASAFLGVPVLHRRSRTQVRLYLDQHVEIDGVHVEYTNAWTATHHYLLLDAGVMTAPLSYGLCPSTCAPGTTPTELDVQAVMLGGGLRYVYLYKADSSELTRSSRGWVEIGARAFLPALNAPIGDVYVNGAKAHTSRPGFVVDAAMEMFGFWPGVWLLGAGMTPSHSPLYFEIGYAYYWF